MGWGSGALLALVAWVGLVAVAVTNGREARHDGSAGRWLVTGAVTVVAVACLLVVFAAATRARAAIRGTAPRRTPGRRRLG